MIGFHKHVEMEVSRAGERHLLWIKIKDLLSFCDDKSGASPSSLQSLLFLVFVGYEMLNYYFNNRKRSSNNRIFLGS